MRPQRRVPNTICDLCPTPIYRRPSTMRINAGKFCSRTCRNRRYPPRGPRGPNPKLQGSRNPAWKGGVTYKRSKGNYIGPRYVRCPPHLLAMARSDGYVMEHRLVMATAIGRLLTRTEVVHHRDHDPRNNDPSNLVLFPNNAAHKRAEALERARGVVAS